MAFWIAAAACGGGGPSTEELDAAEDATALPIDAPPVTPDAPGMHAHHARFVGTWAVEQPFHALYEVTYYTLDAGGAVGLGPSEPPSCGAHLERHCVTGSVARCEPPGGPGCTGTPSCVFGDRWYSTSDRVVVFAGVCSDHVARDIAIELAADPTHDTGWGGAGGTLLTVGGETGWTHDNWDWAFRKCPAGTTPATCRPSS